MKSLTEALQLRGFFIEEHDDYLKLGKRTHIKVVSTLVKTFARGF